MVDLKERFQALDQVPAPDLGRVIELRARHLASVPGALGSDPDAIGGRRFRVPPTQLLAAAAIVILGVGLAVIIHQARITAPVRHAPTPTPPQGQVIPYKGIWPETSLKDAQYAQQRADSGDAAYSWQVDSSQDTHVPQQFLQEQLGWARAAYVGTSYDPPDHGGQESLDQPFLACLVASSRAPEQLFLLVWLQRPLALGFVDQVAHGLSVIPHPPDSTLRLEVARGADVPRFT